MKPLSILVLAVGLSLDAAAVAAARGLLVAELRASHVLKVALLFGGAQALMPLLGWGVGTRLGPLAAAWDHWIAFGLLSLIGGKMLWEARSHDAEQAPARGDVFGLRVMLVLALATSIDAFAMGITLPMLGAPMLVSLLTIGTTTAVLSVAGLYGGRRLGAMLGPRLDALGGVVLIGLGFKTLIEHLTGSA